MNRIFRFSGQAEIRPLGFPMEPLSSPSRERTMPITSRALGFFWLLSTVSLATHARAQTAADTAHAVPWGLISVRYDTRTSNFLYAAYGYRRAFALVGALDNPRSGYTELLIGAGGTFKPTGTSTHFAAVAMARATDGWYTQLYYLPTAHAGPVTARATVQGYLPLEREGVPQLYVSPLSVTTSVARRVDAGVALELAAARGSRSSIEVGPEVRFALPGATLGVDALRNVDAAASRLRAFFTAAF